LRTAGSTSADRTHQTYAESEFRWLYQGLGNGEFAPRVRIGGGWNQYTHLVGTGDADRDGRPDLYAYGPGGKSYFYAGTGGVDGAGVPSRPGSAPASSAARPAATTT
jgi:hypothetical protein